jgi:hypothetical protein
MIVGKKREGNELGEILLKSITKILLMKKLVDFGLN